MVLESCAVKKKMVGSHGLPKNIVVLPVSNQSQDLIAPVLIRYFLIAELKDKGFILTMKGKDVDRQLRQMGIAEGNQIDPSNIQSIGQFFKVDGIMQSTLLEYRQDVEESKRVVRANFRLVSTQSGQVLWEKDVEVRAREPGKIPLRGTLTTDWTPNLIRSIANGPAGKVPRKTVSEALNNLRP